MLRAGITRLSAAGRVGLRSYATPAAQQPVKPPIQLFGVDGTYASALYTAAAKLQTLEATDRNLKQLKQVLEKDTKLHSIIESPALNSEAKTSIVNELSKSVGNESTVKNLLTILAENNRLNLLGSVIKKWEDLMKAHRGEIEAIITSAQNLDQGTLRRLEIAISKSQFIEQGQRLRVVNKLNPDILGGLIVEIGDKTIDLSIASKMAKLNKLLSEPL